MKNIIITIALALLTCSMASAQSTIDKMKQRQELQKMNKNLQETKIDKEARKQAKKDEKEGWKVAPGLLPLAQQYSRSSLMQNQFEDDLLTPKYVWGDASTEAQSYDAAKMQAIEMAQINLVSSIEKNITQIVDTKRGNQQTATGESSSIISSMSKSKTLISQRLGQTTTVVDAYRELPNGHVQVRLMVFYSMDKAREMARDAIREQLRKDGQNISDDSLNKMLGLK